MKSEKRETRISLLKSGLAFFLCVALLVSFTFAWFTTVVKNEGNTITSGSFEFSVWGYDTTEATSVYTAVPDGTITPPDLLTPRNLAHANSPLIKETDFYPGDHQVKFVEIKNLSKVDALFKFALGLSGVDKTKANLSEVIKVNVSGPFNDLSAGFISEKKFAEWETLASYGTDPIFSGPIDKESDAWCVVEYYFCEWAGNTYQSVPEFKFDMIVGGIQARAGEEKLVFVSTEEELLAAIADKVNEGSTIVLLNDITVNGDLDIDVAHNFDLNGYTLTVKGDVNITFLGGCAIDIANGNLIADTFWFDPDGGDSVINLGNETDGPLKLKLVDVPDWRKKVDGGDTEKYTVHTDYVGDYDAGKEIKLIHKAGDPTLPPEYAIHNGTDNTDRWIRIYGTKVYTDDTSEDLNEYIYIPIPQTTPVYYAELKLNLTLMWSINDNIAFILSMDSPYFPI